MPLSLAFVAQLEGHIDALEALPGTAALEPILFDFALPNGRAVQLVQCWSFQLPNQAEPAEQVKAWAWVVRALREQGATLYATGRDVAVPQDIEVAAVAIPPADSQDDTHAYEEGTSGVRAGRGGRAHA